MGNFALREESWPDRASGLTLNIVVNDTSPGPVPDGVRSWIQGELEVTVQGQPAPVMTVMVQVACQ